MYICLVEVNEVKYVFNDYTVERKTDARQHSKYHGRDWNWLKVVLCLSHGNRLFDNVFTHTQYTVTVACILFFREQPQGSNIPVIRFTWKEGRIQKRERNEDTIC